MRGGWGLRSVFLGFPVKREMLLLVVWRVCGALLVSVVFHVWSYYTVPARINRIPFPRQLFRRAPEPHATCDMSDSSLAEFWRVAKTVQAEDNVLEFPVSVEFFSGANRSKILIRDEYRSIWQAINESTNDLHLIVGTQGIGKSYFLLYLLTQLAKNDSAVQNGIIYTKRVEDERKFIVFKGDKVHTGAAAESLAYKIKENSDAWCLMDQGGWCLHSCKSVLAAALDADNYNEFKKRGPCSYYMDEWNGGNRNKYGISEEMLSLIEKCYSHLNNDTGLQLVGQAVGKWGDVPLHAVVNVENAAYQEELEDMVRKNTLKDVVPLQWNRKFDETSSNLIVRPVVNRSDHTSDSYRISTTFIRDKLIRRSSVGTIWDFLRDFVSFCPAMRPAWNSVFEAAVHNNFMYGDKIPCHTIRQCITVNKTMITNGTSECSLRQNQLNVTNTVSFEKIGRQTKISCGKRAIRYFDNVTDIRKSKVNTYWIPKDTDAAGISSVLVVRSKKRKTAYCLQMARDTTRPVQREVLVRLAEALHPKMSLRLAVVVPNHDGILGSSTWMNVQIGNSSREDYKMPEEFGDVQLIAGVDFMQLLRCMDLDRFVHIITTLYGRDSRKLVDF